MSDDDPRDFAAQLAALVADLDRGQGVHTELGELIESAGGAVPGARHVGISLARRRQGVHTVVATRHYPAVLDEIQHHYQEGPSLTAAGNTESYMSITVGRATKVRPLTGPRSVPSWPSSSSLTATEGLP